MFRLFLIALSITSATGSQLTPEEARGRQIYEHGTSASGGSVEAIVAGGEKLAGAIVPCANCHGHDGAGKPEAGVTPSNLTWDALTKPYSLARSDGRARPAYTVHLLKRAITIGADSGGQELSPAMPRFLLSLADAADLVSYIKRLGEPVDPGITEKSIRLGVLLPSQSSQTEAPAAMKQSLIEHFRAVNAAGGLFDRKVDLRFVDLPADPRQRPNAVRDYLGNERVFAVIGDFTGAESEIAAILRETGTPAIAALAPFPPPDSSNNPYVFYLDGGVPEELDALASYAAERFAGKDLPISIAPSDDEITRTMARLLAARLTNSGRLRVAIQENPGRSFGDLVFWIRSDSPSLPAGALANTLVLVPASLSLERHDAPHIVYAVRSLTPEPLSPAGQAWYRASASAALITEALKLAGRGLTRQSLVESMETAEPFSRARRIGTSNIQVKPPDLR